MTQLRTLCLAAALCLTLAGTAYPFCFDEAGALYGINPQILRAIAKVESNFNPNAVHRNTNGTYDFGLMQINSIWAPTLGKERWNSLGDACSNTKAGAWILSMCIEKYGYNWKAIGCYNSQTPDKRDRYSRLVFDQLQKVKPLEIEQAYTPITKERLEGVVRDNVEQWVGEATKGKGSEFVVKVPVPGSAGKQQHQDPPGLNDATPSLSDTGGQTLGLVTPQGLSAIAPEAVRGGAAEVEHLAGSAAGSSTGTP